MKSFLRILTYIKPYWFFALLNVLFNILSAVFALFSFVMAIPFLRILFQQQEMITEPVPFALSAQSIQHNFNYMISNIILEQGPGRALLVVSLLVVIMTFLKTAFKFLANYYVTPVRTGVVRDIRNNVYNRILKLPLSYFSESRKGDVISRVSMDVNEIELSIMSSLEMVFRDPITIIIYLAFMIYMSPTLTLLVLVLLPLSGYFIGRLGKNLRAHSRTSQSRMGMILSLIEETLSGLRIIKAFNAEKRVADSFSRTNNLYTSIVNKVYRRRYLASPLSEFLGTVVMMALMYLGGQIVLRGTTALDSESFIAYLIVFSQIITPAKAFSTAYFNIQKGMAASDRIDTILKAKVTIKDKPGALPKPSFESTVTYRNVWFRYEQEMVLKDINFTIEKGKTIAIVGKSGSGKSTLVDLLPRFIDPVKGDILIDGERIDRFRISDSRNLMGIVSQQSILFNDTFMNNIAFGKDEINEDEVIAAAKVANAHDFIMETPLGYHTNVGDAGSKLSGGQKQRISIARALLKNPPILILDEATSSLDTESERLVQEAIIHLMKNRTSIVIAHRLSTVKHADKIIVLDEGRIVETGRHKELIGRENGLYKKLHDLQMF